MCIEEWLLHIERLAAKTVFYLNVLCISSCYLKKIESITFEITLVFNNNNEGMKKMEQSNHNEFLEFQSSEEIHLTNSKNHGSRHS